MELAPGCFLLNMFWDVLIVDRAVTALDFHFGLARLFTHSFTHPSVCLSVRLPTHPSIRPFTFSLLSFLSKGQILLFRVDLSGLEWPQPLPALMMPSGYQEAKGFLDVI